MPPFVITTSATVHPSSACLTSLHFAVTDLVYATTGYEASIANAAQVTLASDNVFSNGASLELATITGSVAGGFTAALTIAV